MPPYFDDNIGQLIYAWQRNYPNLDTIGTEVTGRVVRLASIINKLLDDNLQDDKLNVGEFDVLAALARVYPATLTPTELQAQALVSSGGISNRINRMEKKAWLHREHASHDRRSVHVSLSDSGKNCLDKVVDSHVAIEKQLANVLSTAEQQQLARLLSKMLSALEPLNP